MRKQHLHIYRNSPAGRETLLAAKLMARRLGVPLAIWIPSHKRLCFTHGMHELLVTLDSSYLRSPETAVQNIAVVLDEDGPPWHLVEPIHFKDKGLPELPTDFMGMTCPRVISDRTERVGLGHLGPGHIGPAVSAVVKHAEHPVFVPGTIFVPWDRIAVLYGGSPLGVTSVRVGLALHRQSGIPISIYTFAPPDTPVEPLELALEEAGLLQEIRRDANWEIWRTGTFDDHLFKIPRNALIVVGAAGHNPVHDLFATSKLKMVQKEWPGPILVPGPSCTI